MTHLEMPGPVLFSISPVLFLYISAQFVPSLAFSPFLLLHHGVKGTDMSRQGHKSESTEGAIYTTAGYQSQCKTCGDPWNENAAMSDYPAYGFLLSLFM